MCMGVYICVCVYVYGCMGVHGYGCMGVYECRIYMDETIQQHMHIFERNGFKFRVCAYVCMCVPVCVCVQGMCMSVCVLGALVYGCVWVYDIWMRPSNNTCIFLTVMASNFGYVRMGVCVYGCMCMCMGVWVCMGVPVL